MTREALRAAAERLFDERGADGVSVRAVADEVGTTTRAVYSLFGSREGLLIDLLAERAYELLDRGLTTLPETDDPAGDLIEAGVTVFRPFVREHPSLFRIAFQRVAPDLEPGPQLVAARARLRPARREDPAPRGRRPARREGADRGADRVPGAL